MIVEPSSLQPRSPFRRLLRRVGFVAPAVLLAGVAAAGMAGPKPPPSASPAASPSSADPPSPSRGPSAIAPALTAPSVLAFGDAGFPTAYLTIAAMHPSEVLAARSSAAGAPLVLAVAGYLGDVGTVAGCAEARAASGAWCERRGLLADRPVGAPGSVGGFAPHLHVVVPPGVTLPGTLAAAARAGRSWVPVEVLGRFTVPGQCGGGGPSCEHGFVVERVVWADGAFSGVDPLREPGLLAHSPAAPAAIAATPTLLMAVLVHASSIAALDPSAAATASHLWRPQALVWYVRELSDLDNDGPDEPVVRWALIDAGGITPVASGPSTLPTVDAVLSAAASALP